MPTRSWLALVLAVLCAWSAAASETSPKDEPRRPLVLMVFGSGMSAPAAMPSQKAFEKALTEKLGRAVDFQAVYLDLAATPPTDYEGTLASLLAQKYGGSKPDLIFAQRPEALAFLIRQRATLFPGAPIVFTELMEAEFESMTLPPDVTGVLIAGLIRTVPVALALFPDTRQFVVVTGSGEFDRQTAAAIRQHVHSGWPTLGVEMLDGKSLEEQRARLAALPPDSVVLFGTYRREASGRTIPVNDVLEVLSQASTRPIFAFQAHHLGAGIFGGDLIQLDVLARRAAGLAARILTGTPPSALPVVRDPSTAMLFDARQLKRWDISERRLPVGSEVRFRERTLWNDYRTQVLWTVAVLLAQGGLIAGLVFERRRRRRIQTKLADAEQRYRTVADFAADWEYWILSDGAFLYVSPSSEQVTGFSPQQFMDRPSLVTEIVVDEDRDVWLRHRAQARDTAGTLSAEFRIRTRDGEIRWIEHVCTGVKGPDGTDLGRRGSNRDITERRQAEADLRVALRENQELRDRLEVDNSYLREQLAPKDGIAGLLGTSDAMGYVASRVRQVAPTSSTVLLLGETGVGKTLLAQAIHDLSPRSARPLVTLNCAALPPALIESELFGHEKGAFTGALARRVGRFEVADGGTLFLDEVTELPLELQGKLLRAVQDGAFERVGSSVTQKVDLRLIVASNRVLDDEVRAGRFRQDLLYRLNIFPITVPPLRQRQDDIPLLVAHFVHKHARRLGVEEPQFSRSDIKALQARPWPGNIRELENVIERALISSRTGRFEIEDDTGRGALGTGTGPTGAAEDSRTLEQLERDHMTATLERLQWRVEGPGGAAEALGMNASTLRSRMRKHGIRRPGSQPGGSRAS